MRGSVTVFFSMIFVTVLSVLGGTIESARWACARLYWKQAATDSIRSVFADYCAPMFEEYGLLFVDKTYGEEEDMLDKRFEEYLSYNIEPSKGSLYKRSFLYKGTVSNIEVTDVVLAIDGKGAVLKSSAYDYMKYRIPVDLVERFLEQFDFISQADVIQDFFDKLQRIERDMERVNEAVTGINSFIEEIRGLQETIEQRAKEVNELLKVEKPDDKVKKKLEDKKTELLDAKKDVMELVGEILEQSDIYGNATQNIGDYLQGLADGWVRDLDVSQGIKDVIMSEIENLLTYSGGREDVYGIEKNSSWLQMLTKELKTWSQDYTSGKFEELDTLELSLDWLKESVGEVTSRFNVNSLWSELKSDGMYALLCPGYDKLSEAVIEPFYNRAYANYRAISYAPGQSVVSTVTENIVFQEYMGQMFSSYADCGEDSAIKYELEYIIGGKTVDKENINVVMNELLLLREGLNLLYIMCDSQKKEEAYSLAMSCVGFTGVYVAVKTLQYAILAAWAFGESMLDVRVLMSGGTVPMMKSASDWRLDLDELTKIGGVLTSIGSSGKSNGFGAWNYEDYLKILLYMGISDEQTLRAMDVMEANIQKNYSKDFRIVNCTYKADMRMDFKLSTLFDKNEVFNKSTGMSFGYSY